MAPAKRSKSLSKRVAIAYDVSPSKGVGIMKKSRQKKKPKLVNMLGPQWSKQELQRFYQGFRKYGSDWKKVASIIRNRSPEMVEALYNMNRAYLSLPEGTASVVGLIAMMTDHYSNLGGSGSERDDDPPGVSGSPQKYANRSRHVGLSQEQLLQSFSPRQTDDCLSLLRKGMQPYIPKRKRTLRVPIPPMERKYHGIGSIPSIKGGHRSQVEMHVDQIAHGVMLLLAEAQHQIGSFQVCSTAIGAERDNKRTQLSIGKQLLSNSDLVQDKYHGMKMDDGSPRERNDEPTNRVNAGPSRGGLYFEATKSRSGSSSHRAPRKRSKKLFTEDESLACDALQALANMSLALSASTAEPGETFQKAMTTSPHHVESSRESANAGETTIDSAVLSDARLDNPDAYGGSRKKKQKTLKAVVKQSDLRPGRPIEEKALAEEDSKSGNMFKEYNHVHADTTHCRAARSSVVTSASDQEVAEVDFAVSSRQHPATDQAVLPSKQKSLRKRHWPLIGNDRNNSPSSSKDLLNKHSTLLSGAVPDPKNELSHCLSSPLVRRWCGFEWFYSAIDYPWFSDKEFVEYLNHVGLAHIPRLTRVEWGVIRSSLGKPRRFSRHFLKEEREKLERYRESVRTHYSELRAGTREGLPTDLARPLSVGQRVIAIHPKTREINNGSILTVDHDKFRVQFDRPELGVEFVMDINCMPCNQLENMPEAMRRQQVSNHYGNSKEPSGDAQSMLVCSESMQSPGVWKGASAFSHAVVNQAKIDPTFASPYSKEAASDLLKMSSSVLVEGFSFQMWPREADSQQAGRLNNSLGRKVQPFLFCPKQEVSCPGNLPYAPLPTADIGGAARVLRSIGDHEDSASKVAEIVRHSREKAHEMVDAAIQAISSLSEGQNPYERIGEALDSINKLQHPSEPGLSFSPSPNPTNGILNEQTDMKACNSVKTSIDSSLDAVPGANNMRFPSELITSCVATLLMIQTCTDRQYPPTEVAHMLDNAVSSMHPCCPQNLSVYRELEMCMGRIKTQILALIPS